MMRACPRAHRTPLRARPVPAGHLLAIAIGAAAGGYLRVGPVARALDGLGRELALGDVLGQSRRNVRARAAPSRLLHARGRSASVYRPLVGVGFCGALTTFSTLQLEIFRMLRADHWLLAAGYVVVSVLAGLAVAFAGVALGSRGRAA